MVHEYAFPIVLAEDRTGGYVASCPDLPEVLTQGEDRMETIEQATDALEEAIAGRIRRGEDIPEASAVPRGENVVVVRVPPIMAAKAALAIAIRETGMSRSSFARKMGVDEKEVRRLLDPRHPSKLPRLQEALSVLGRALAIRVVPVATPEATETRPGSYPDLEDASGGAVSEPPVADSRSTRGDQGQTLIAVPTELVPEVRALIAKHLQQRDPDTT